ncbi:hypothetical protein LOZ57_000854 [Ophidiomyces ophidiicola]|uniref:uncharacterized protein n=1 Tax=Ophidiomyces ophidiicola TaxID=1387563 RepID=UPI0020C2C761|nr:uncharacterized protein LOZ57_000854 [Ophidiomyces ophidiicola]KAI1952772.1 hypothetical protein LOZ57_000854 [Ophidiomyces ophidiicola]KAI2058067.1 hypothetical protein LOZ43_002825 [Ophidiomyces ophidiicola]
MKPDKCLKADEFRGTVGEGENAIEIAWKNNAQSRLDGDAKKLKTTSDRVKAVTEHLVYHSALRLKKPTSYILGALNDTTTSARTGLSTPDPLHTTVTFRPGKLIAHIYVGNCGEGETAFDNLTVEGESVVDPDKREQVESLSIGTYPKFSY